MVERTNQKGLIEPVFSHDVRAAILVSQKKPGPYWCPEPILWELNSFLMQTLSFVPINLHRCWPREWKHSTEILKYIGAFLWDHLDQDQWSEITRISRSNEPMNPCPEWIHRFIWSTMIRVIWLDHLRGTHLQILIHSSTSLPLRPSFRSCVTVSSSRHNALFIISEKMASIRRILQTGQTGNLANASYQQPRRVTLKHFCLLLRCDDGLEKELGNWLLFSYFYPTFVFSCRSAKFTNCYKLSHLWWPMKL